MQHVEIRVKGEIDEKRSDWFQGLSVVAAGPNQTILTGHIADQSALFGLVTKVRDLGLALISVRVTDVVEEEA